MTLRVELMCERCVMSTARYGMTHIPGEISGLRCSVIQGLALLGRYAVYVGSCLPTYRNSLSVCPIFWDFSVQEERRTLLTLGDGTVMLPSPTSLTNYTPRLRNVPEE